MSFERRCEVRDSTNITMVAFDPAAEKMRVEFKNGDCYDYSGIIGITFGAIVGANSVGNTFQKLIRNNAAFKFKKVG